jgi:hypothetical protein
MISRLLPGSRGLTGSLALTLGFVGAIVNPAHADLVPPNEKIIMHVLRVEGQREYAGKYRFYMVTRPWRMPVPREGAKRPLITATPLSSNGELNTKNVSPIYALHVGAIPAKKEIRGDVAALFEEPANGVLLSEPIDRRRTAPEQQPETTLTTRYKIVIKDIPGAKDTPAVTKLSLAKVSEEWTGIREPAGRGVLVVVSAVALLGLVGRLRSRHERA